MATSLLAVAIISQIFTGGLGREYGWRSPLRLSGIHGIPEEERLPYGRDGRYPEYRGRHTMEDYMPIGDDYPYEEDIYYDSRFEQETERKIKLRQEELQRELERDIQNCERDMKLCKFSAEELVNKILENMDNGGLLRPEENESVEARKVAVLETEPSVQARQEAAPVPELIDEARIRGVAGPSGPGGLSLPANAAMAERRRQPTNVCSNFCIKRRTTNTYTFNCMVFRYDQRLTFNQRRNLMMKCYECRRTCNTFRYI